MKTQYKLSQDTIEEIHELIIVLCNKLLPNVDNRSTIEMLLSHTVDKIEKGGGIRGLSSWEYRNNMRQAIFEVFCEKVSNTPIYLNEMFAPKDKNVFS